MSDMNNLKPPTKEYLEWKSRVTESRVTEGDVGGQVQWAINSAKSLISTLQDYENAKTWSEKLKYILTAIGAVGALTAVLLKIKDAVGGSDSKGSKNSNKSKRSTGTITLDDPQ